MSREADRQQLPVPLRRRGGAPDVFFVVCDGLSHFGVTSLGPFGPAAAWRLSAS